MKSYRGIRQPMGRHRDMPGGPRQQMVMLLLIPALLAVAVLQWRWIVGNKNLLHVKRAVWYVERVPCDLCGQTGVYREEEPPYPQYRCPICLGRGAGFIRKMDARDVICPACGGMGRLDDGLEGRWCGRCGGRGLIRADELLPDEPLIASPSELKRNGSPSRPPR